jgi:uncharacterized damage-inducible protein DinB
MHPLHGVIQQLNWAAKNTVYNLDFVPDDKLDWKPAPTASSVLEIINHVMMPLRAFGSVLQGNGFNHEGAQATNREEAKQLLLEAVQNYTAVLQSLKPEDLQGTVTVPFGEMPMGMAVGVPMVDLIHHHGQISYLQTLWGDTEPHIQMWN